MVQVTKNIGALIEHGGEITLGAQPPHECAATAADGSHCLAMPVRRDGESLNALLQRLDRPSAWLGRMMCSSTKLTTAKAPCCSPLAVPRSRGPWGHAYFPYRVNHPEAAAIDWQLIR